MIWIDFAILGLLLISALIGFIRGFAKEALSLLSWAAAIWVSLVFTSSLAALFSPFIGSIMVSGITAFILLFVVTLILGSLLSMLLNGLISKVGLGGLDRFLGIVFGLLRGGVVVTVLVLVLGLTPVPKQQWWQDAVLLEYFQMAARWLGGQIAGVAYFINY